MTASCSWRTWSVVPLVCAAALSAAASGAGMAQAPGAPPALLPMSRQIEVREGWLAHRYQLLLPMMRAHGVGMWVVVNEEFHDDPLTWLVAPPRPYVGRRDIFVFIDGGDSGLKRVAITGYAEESVQRFFESPEEPAPAAKVLPALIARYQPKTIALGVGGARGVTRSLTHDAYVFLLECLGPEAAKRVVPAEPLIEEYVDTRSVEEAAHYGVLVEWTEHLARRALSNEVITPGVTTVGDVRRWLYDQSAAAGFVPWFQPDLRIQRRRQAAGSSRGFLVVAREAVVIEPGDVVHLDFGLNYMGLASDWQKMAYVLREGETAAPAGLARAMANTNVLQDTLARMSRPGKLAADAFDSTMAEMKARGITAQVYSHPLGNHGHGLGASVDMRTARPGQDAPARRLRSGSYLAMELNTQTPVPEWDNQPVTVMAEDPVYLTDEGWRFFRPRQEAFYLITTGVAARPDYPDGLYADLWTSKGLISLRLAYEQAPLSVANFVGLAEGTVVNKAVPPGHPFYDGTVFHRVVPGHVIQAGMAKAGDTAPGYTFPNEIVPGLGHGRAGIVGMANAGPHTNASQFYITLGDRSYLDGSYTVFGDVFKGLDVAARIAQGDVVRHIRIVRVGPRASAFAVDEASFRARVETARARVNADEATRARNEGALLRKSWPGAAVTASGARIIVRRRGTGDPAKAGQVLTARYTGRFLDGRPFASSAEAGRPTAGTAAIAFEYEPGRTRINPAVEEALAAMRPGERRTVIAQGDAGYGPSGFYSREKPGEKRFVIPPGTTLVYELELISVRR